MYIAHKKENGELQPLKEHLRGVADAAARFAEPFKAADHAWSAGLIHDAGKYSEKGQQRMMDPEHVAKVDHSTAGAKIALQTMRDRVLAECVAGHHSGLMDMRSKYSSEGDGTLLGRCRKTLDGPLSYCDCWKNQAGRPIRSSEAAEVCSLLGMIFVDGSLTIQPRRKEKCPETAFFQRLFR